MLSGYPWLEGMRRENKATLLHGPLVYTYHHRQLCGHCWVPSLSLFYGCRWLEEDEERAKLPIFLHRQTFRTGHLFILTNADNSVITVEFFLCHCCTGVLGWKEMKKKQNCLSFCTDKHSGLATCSYLPTPATLWSLLGSFSVTVVRVSLAGRR